MKKSNVGVVLLAVIALVMILIYSLPVYAIPAGPNTLTILGNTTSTVPGGQKVNSTINGSISPGGFIFTAGLQSTQQNTRWKGYVGNVTGTLALDDASGNTLFQWSLTTITGEVYATRGSGNINWTGINCTWHGENSSSASNSFRVVEEAENKAINHSNREDNITATFSLTNHSQIVVGSVIIPKNSCFSVQTWQKDAVQSFADSDSANFTQVLLYDGTNNSVNKTDYTLRGNVVYEAKIESDVTGFNSGETYDFQMILPESGLATWSGSTAYYFYVELS